MYRVNTSICTYLYNMHELYLYKFVCNISIHTCMYVYIPICILRYKYINDLPWIADPLLFHLSMVWTRECLPLFVSLTHALRSWIIFDFPITTALHHIYSSQLLFSWHSCFVAGTYIAGTLFSLDSNSSVGLSVGETAAKIKQIDVVKCWYPEKHLNYYSSFPLTQVAH